MFNCFVIIQEIGKNNLKDFLAQPGIQPLVIEPFSGPDQKNIEISRTKKTMSAHYHAILEAKNRDYPLVFIFEDDAVTPDWFVLELVRFYNCLPQDWDLVFWGGVHERSPWPECFPVHIAGPVYRGYKTAQQICYMLHARAYDNTLKILKEFLDLPEGLPSSAFQKIQSELNFYVPLNLPVDRSKVMQKSMDSENFSNLELIKNRGLAEGWFTGQEGVQYLT